MVSDPIHTISGYDIISLGMEYLMRYIIPFRLVVESIELNKRYFNILDFYNINN